MSTGLAAITQALNLRSNYVMLPYTSGLERSLQEVKLIYRVDVASVLSYVSFQEIWIAFQ